MLVHHRIPSRKWLGILLLPLDGMLVHHRIPSIQWLGVLLLPPGWDASPSQDTQHKVNRSITTPHWMGCWTITGDPQKWLGILLLPLDGMLVHHRVPSIRWLGVLLLHPGWDAGPSKVTSCKLSCLLKHLLYPIYTPQQRETMMKQSFCQTKSFDTIQRPALLMFP